MMVPSIRRTSLRLAPKATASLTRMISSSRVIHGLSTTDQDKLSEWKRLHGLKETPPQRAEPSAVVQDLKAVHAVRSPVAVSKILLSDHMTQRATRDTLKNIDLLVSDMAGTVVNEGGVVYQTLQRVMIEDGLDVPDDAMHPWHGAKKENVIEHFAAAQGTRPEDLEARIVKLSDNFLLAIEDSYFSDNSAVSLIDPQLPAWLGSLRAAGVKVALDTGYPARIQQGLVKKLGFDALVDGYISAYEVRDGRPFPYMIHHLMEQLGIENVRRVAKVGDSVRDIEEGHNAGCGLVIGVTSGADSAEDLLAAGADVIADVITNIPVPTKKITPRFARLPDLS
jgi:phosphonatase-like hydrolase